MLLSVITRRFFFFKSLAFISINAILGIIPAVGGCRVLLVGGRTIRVAESPEKLVESMTKSIAEANGTLGVAPASIEEKKA